MVLEVVLGDGEVFEAGGESLLGRLQAMVGRAEEGQKRRLPHQKGWSPGLVVRHLDLLRKGGKVKGKFLRDIVVGANARDFGDVDLFFIDVMSWFYRAFTVF